MNKNDIPIWTQKELNYRNGLASIGGGVIYGKDFNDASEKVILRDCGLCQGCKQKGEVVHHINGLKWIHRLDNLILLCLSCHRKLHSKRGVFPLSILR